MGNVAQQIAQQWADQGALIANGDTAELGHVHQQTDVTDLTTELANKLDSGEVGVSVAPLVSGVVPLANIPSIPLGITHEVADQAAMLALDADVGDFAIIAGVATYRLKALPADTLGNWVELPVTPGVTSVQGLTGAVLLPVATPSIDGLMSAADKSMIAANTANIATNTSAITTNTSNIAAKITDPGGATEGQVLSYVGGTPAWSDASGGDTPWIVVNANTHGATVGEKLAITNGADVTITLPGSASPGEGIEIENISAVTVSLLGTVNSGLNPLLLPSTLRTYLIWTASGWQCRDATYPTYGLTGTFTNGSAITSTDELFYAIGTNLGTASWVNPHTAGRIQVVMSSVRFGTLEQLCDRSNSSLYTESAANSWFGVDFGMGTGRQVQLSAFRTQHYTSTGEVPQSCVIEGSNGLASNSVADFNAATWDPIINIGSLGIANSASAWSSNHVIASSQWYRWIRVRQTALNSQSSNIFVSGEMAFGGKIRFT